MAADYAMPRRWLTPSRSRACRWIGVGVVTIWKPGRSGSAGWMWFRQMVARSRSRVAKLCTGWPSWVRLVAALASAFAERVAGATGLVPGGLGGWLVVVGEQHGRQAGLHVPGDVVGEHPQEHVRADPGLGAVPDGPDVQVGVEGAEGALDVGEGLVGGDDFVAVQPGGWHAGAQHVDAVQGGFGGDGAGVTGVAEVIVGDARW